MKIQINSLVKQAAATLLVTLFLITLIAVSIAGYLSYVEQQTLLGARSQSWNQAIAVSEAGVEEALQLLNTDISTYSANGWSLSGTTYTSPTRALGNGNSYAVTIDASSPNSPIVVSRATVSPPSLTSRTSRFFLAAAGVNVSQTTTITRAVRVKTGRGNLFLAALVAKHKITMNGNNVRTDSYDSADPTKSTNGRWDAAKAGDLGDVASNDGVLNAVSVGNANIYGHVHTGPDGTVSIGSQGGIGTHAWQQANGNTPQPGYVSDTANFTFPDTSLPYNSGTAPSGGNVVTITGFTTNVTSFVGVASPPGAPPSGYSIGTVTTNTAFTTTSIYPGAKPGLTTNLTYTTVATYPGAQPGMTTNFTHFASSLTYPGAQPGLSSNTVSTTSGTMPSPAPAGLTTNYLSFVTTLSNPGAQPGLTLGSMSTNSATKPSPTPAGLLTNTTSMTSLVYPIAGTYVGGVSTNVVKTGPPSGRGTFYTYNFITGYSYSLTTYTYATSFSYTYPLTTYLYADQFSYTYQTYTYTYPAYTYTYSLYAGVPVYSTNYYDHVLEGGHDYYATTLTGTSIVTGPNVRLVMPTGFAISGNNALTIASDPLHIGAGLTVYSGGTSISLAGNSVLNEGGFAGSFIVYAAPTVTSIAFSGNAGFTGVLVAPNANLALNGGGNNTYDFMGALLVNSATLNGHFNFHYDEALSRMGGNGRFIITQWDEIP